MSDNPWRAPAADLSQPAVPGLWSWRGRITRLRWAAVLCSCMLLQLLIWHLLGWLWLQHYHDSTPFPLVLLSALPVTVFLQLQALRRLRDLACPLWLSVLLLLTPGINLLSFLLLLALPGRATASRHGPLASPWVGDGLLLLFCLSGLCALLYWDWQHLRIHSAV